jgi:membrane protease YdiL (CAAX protease family)
MDRETHRKVGYATIPLAIFLLSRFIYSGPFLFLLAPMAIVLLVERRSITTIGIRFERHLIPQYVLVAAVGFLLLEIESVVDIYVRRELWNEVVDLSGPASYGKELIAQMLFVGGPEEVFYRGYLMSRLGNLLGNVWGLCSSSFLFGLEHFLSRLFRYGFTLTAALQVGVRTMIGGLILGWQFQQTRSIFPSLVAHIAGNLCGCAIAAIVLGP